MILKVLADYYDALARQGKVTLTGWSKARVSFGLCLDEEGNLVDIYSLKMVPEGGKKELPKEMDVPEQVKKTSGVSSNFLCENSAYLLGIDSKGNDNDSTDSASKENRALKCFEAAKELHHLILDPYGEDPDVRALLGFFDHWDPEKARENEVLEDYLDEILKGANLIFIAPDSCYMQDKEIMKTAWEAYKTKTTEAGGSLGRCLVTGEMAPIARLHPSIKGVYGAQSSGASLVSFNAAAFESYGHEISDSTGQGLNSPVSELAAFKYATALNYMIADKDHSQRLSDMTIVYWAEDADPAYQDAMNDAFFGDADNVSPERLSEIAGKLRNGEAVPYERSLLKGDTQFFVMGITPNAARLAVSFYRENAFSNMLDNLVKHYDDLDLVKPVFAENQKITMWGLLFETVNKNSKDKKAANPIISALLHAILEGTEYPAGLYENVMLRVCAEHDVNWKKAAIIKAYLLRFYRRDKSKRYLQEEVLGVELNKDSDYVPYVLGREFAVLERIQQLANPGIKATIKDRYFTSASATPGPIFAMLMKLSQHHMRKLSSEGERFYYDKMLMDLEGKLHEPVPARMNLQDQGIFYLGYYHQKQTFFTKKEEKENE